MYRLWGRHLGSPVPEWLPAWPGEPSPPGPSSLLPPPAGAGPEGSHCPTVASAPAREAKATNFTVPGDGQRPGTSWEVSTGHQCRLACPGESPQHTDPHPPRLNRGPAPRWDAGMSGRQRCSAQLGLAQGVSWTSTQQQMEDKQAPQRGCALVGDSRCIVHLI